jgi:hypothetical protein
LRQLYVVLGVCVGEQGDGALEVAHRRRPGPELRLGAGSQKERLGVIWLLEQKQNQFVLGRAGLLGLEQKPAPVEPHQVWDRIEPSRLVVVSQGRIPIAVQAVQFASLQVQSSVSRACLDLPRHRIDLLVSRAMGEDA